MSRVTITKIESGGQRAENAPLHEVLALAAALGVAPVHLFVPLDDEGVVEITPKLRLPAPQAREWIRGMSLLPGADLRAYEAYLEELPESERWEWLEAMFDGEPTAWTRHLSATERRKIGVELAREFAPALLALYRKQQREEKNDG